MHRIPVFRALILSVLFAFGAGARAQETATAKPAADLSSWKHVQNLPAKTKVHITTDHGGRTCQIFAVTEDALTCAKGSAAGAVVPRAEIKHIKLTHYLRSSLVGFGVGGGLGAAIGGIAGRTKPCTPNTLCFNGLGGGAPLAALVIGVPSAIIGAIAGGTTDMARGSSIYVRP